MSRKFRLTCARTAYFEVELEAENGAEAEKQLAAVLEKNPRLGERDALIGKPIYRVVEVAAAEAESSSGTARAHAA